MSFLQYLLMSFLMVFASAANAQGTISTDTQFVSNYEKQAVVEWVINKTNNRASKEYAETIVSAVYTHAFINGVDPLIILGMITKESMFKKQAQSGYGAKGLMQVVPRYHKAALKGRDPFNIFANIEVGTQYVKYCLENRKTFVGAMNCYSGSAKGYSGSVQATHKEIKTAIILSLFQNQQEIKLPYNVEKPLIQKSKSTLFAGI